MGVKVDSMVVEYFLKASTLDRVVQQCDLKYIKKCTATKSVHKLQVTS